MSDSVGSVSVDVVPDARGWAEKLRAQIRDTSVEVKADADTEEANAELDRTARTRTAKIKTDVSQLSQGASMLDRFVGQLGLLPALAVAAGAALIPLGAAFGGVAASLGGPLIAGAGGAGLFAVVATVMAKQANEAAKNADKLRQAYDTATPGPEKVAALKAWQDAVKAMTPAQNAFLDAQDRISNAFQKLTAGPAGQAVFGTLIQGMNTLSGLLPALTPWLVATSGAFSDLLGDFKDFTGTSTFHQLNTFFAAESGKAIKLFGEGVGNLALGFGHLFKNLTPTGNGILREFVKATEGFSTGKSKAMRDFVDYFHKVGPDVADTLRSLARSFGHIVEALAPLGPPVLNIIKGIADAFNSIPIPVLTGIAGAAAGLVAFQKLGGFKATALLSRGLGGTSGGVGGILSGSVQKVFVVNMGEGGLGGGGGFLGKTKGILGKTIPGVVLGGEALTVGGAAGVAGVAAVAAGTAFGLWKTWQAESAPGKAPNVAGMTPAQTLKFNQQRIANQMGSPNPFAIDARIQARSPSNDLANSFDAMRAHAQAASRQIELIGPNTHAAVGSAIRDIARLNGAMNLPDPKFTVIANTADAIHRLEALQAKQIADKSFTVYQRNQIIERTVGPGGGMGQLPHGSAPGSGSGGGASRGGVIHTHVHLNDREIGHAITPYIDASAEADRRFANMRAGG